MVNVVDYVKLFKQKIFLFKGFYVSLLTGLTGLTSLTGFIIIFFVVCCYFLSWFISLSGWTFSLSFYRFYRKNFLLVHLCGRNCCLVIFLYQESFSFNGFFLFEMRFVPHFLLLSPYFNVKESFLQWTRLFSIFS